MNKKGFTLVELLATITILALLTVIASTSVTKVIKDSKKDLSQAQMKLIKEAAQTWGAENMSLLPKEGKCRYLTIKDLKGYGLLNSSIKDPKDNKEIDEKINIKITTEQSDYGNIVTNYELNPKSTEGCIKYYMYGDIDQNGIVDEYDVLYMDLYTTGWQLTYISDNVYSSSGIEPPEQTFFLPALDHYYFKIVDVDLDGTLDNQDYALILQYVSGWDVKWPE